LFERVGALLLAAGFCDVDILHGALRAT
jgi:hypothetical protein